MMLAKRAVLIFLASCAQQAHANVFLGPHPEEVSSEKASEAFEHALLGEMESVLGSEHRTFTEKRLSKIEEAVRPIFHALPKNKHGRLGHGPVSYMLHRLFVQRHAWFINSLDPGSKGLAAWNDTSPVTLFVDKVPEYVQSMFEKRFVDVGMGVHEIAVLAATFEHLVHKEAIHRLQLAYQARQFSPEDVLTISEATEILDTYMAVYILGFTLKNKTAPSLGDIKILRDYVADIYPTWPDTQKFVHEVQESVAPNRDYLYFSDSVTVIEEVGERYGRWQDLECRALKETLLTVEDTGLGGAGRVRLADFYGLALNDGKWQFSESITYLRGLGALDESDPEIPRVIITNYLTSASNCVASSSYYSVCCINECESLIAVIEQELAKPEALASEIATVVSTLLSFTQQTKRQLSPWLLQQLDNVAAHHGGVVPIHGRLFSQWMHFAYPRECPYPHIAGTTDPTQLDMVFQSQAASDFSASEDEMRHHFDSVPARQEQISNVSAHEEFTMISMDEELVVERLPQNKDNGPISSLLRGSAFVGAIVSLSIGLMKSFESQIARQLVDTKAEQKYYV